VQEQAKVANLLQAGGLTDQKTVENIRAFVARHPAEYILFHRTHAFELLRALTLWSKDFDSQSVLANGVEDRKSFISAVLMAYEIFSLRVEIPSLQDQGNDQSLSFGLLRTLREKSLLAPSMSNPLVILGRGSLLMDKFFFASKPGYKQAFESHVQMTLEEYRDCAICLIAQVCNVKVDQLTTISDQYIFDMESLRTLFPGKEEDFKRFLNLESISIAQMEEKFGGQKQWQEIRAKGED
jgi:hypothetical protein